jgi:hypothetical protein
LFTPLNSFRRRGIASFTPGNDASGETGPFFDPEENKDVGIVRVSPIPLAPPDNSGHAGKLWVFPIAGRPICTSHWLPALVESAFAAIARQKKHVKKALSKTFIRQSS